MLKLDSLTVLGLLAATCTTLSLLPQTLRIIATKQTRDISLSMYLVFSIGILLWLAYGIFKKDLPIISANIITFALSFTILVLKIKYD